MPISTYRTPGVYVQEVPAGPRPIQAVGTRTAGFIGEAQLDDAYKNEPRAVNNWSEFVARFMPEEEKDRKSTALSNAVFGFFQNGGSRCFIVNTGRKATWTTHLRPLRSKTRSRSWPRRDALTRRATRRS